MSDITIISIQANLLLSMVVLVVCLHILLTSMRRPVYNSYGTQDTIKVRAARGDVYRTMKQYGKVGYKTIDISVTGSVTEITLYKNGLRQ